MVQNNFDSSKKPLLSASVDGVNDNAGAIK
jgi:hypothetical protein